MILHSACLLIPLISSSCASAFIVRGGTHLHTRPNIIHMHAVRSAPLLGEEDEGRVGEKNLDRRSLFSTFLQTSLVATSASFLLAIEEAKAETTGSGSMQLESYEDTECGFSLSVPSKWEKSTQKLPDRRKIVLFVNPETKKEENDKTLLFIAYTPVRDDYTQLSSFGSAEQVGQMTILPKSSLAGVEDTESIMYSAESKKNAYFFDYSVKVPDQPKRHLRTIFSLVPGATGGAGSMLVTITAQTSESNYSAMKKAFDGIFDSYGKLGPSKK